VQQTFLRAFEQLAGFEPRREGASLAYLRQILMNQILDHIRHAARRPASVPSPAVQMIEANVLQAFEAALEQLTDKQRQALLLRFEAGFSYEQVAEAIGSPSVDAARMLVRRARVRIAELMRENRDAGGGGS
jgi:RNA polymerase sigma-70 factor, ECF subfamily